MSTVGGVNLKLGLKIGSFMRNMRLASKEMSFGVRNAGRLSEKVAKVGVTFGTMARGAHVAVAAIQAIGMAVAAATTAFAAFAVASSRTFGDFEHSMARAVSVTAGGFQNQGQMMGRSLQLARKYGVEAKEVGNAMTFLGMAGFDAKETMKATDAVMKIATIGQMDFAAAADITSNIMTTFGLKADDAGQAVEWLTGTITNYNVNMRMMGDAMKYVGSYAMPLFKKMGKGASDAFRQTSAALGVMGDRGVQGEMAGTALRNVLKNVSTLNSSKRGIAKAGGLDFFDAGGDLKQDIIGIVREIEEADTNIQDLVAMFGARGMQGLLPLLEAGSAQLEAFTKYLDDYREATKITTFMQQTFNTELAKFKVTAQEALMGAGMFFKEFFVSLRQQFAMSEKDFLQFKLDVVDFAATGMKWLIKFAMKVIDVLAFMQTFGTTTFNILELGARTIGFAVTGLAAMITKVFRVMFEQFYGVALKNMIGNTLRILKAIPAALRDKLGIQDTVESLEGVLFKVHHFPTKLKKAEAAMSKSMDGQKEKIKELALEIDKGGKVSESFAKAQGMLSSSLTSVSHAAKAAKSSILEMNKAQKDFEKGFDKSQFSGKWAGNRAAQTGKKMAEDRAKAIVKAMKAAKGAGKGNQAEAVAEAMAAKRKLFMDDLDKVLEDHELLQAKLDKEKFDSVRQMINAIDSSGFDPGAVGDEVANKNFELQKQFMTMEERRVALAARHNAQLERQLSAMRAITDVGRDMGNSIMDYSKAMAAATTPGQEALAQQQLMVDTIGAAGKIAMQSAALFGASRRQMAMAQMALNIPLLAGAILTGNWATAFKAGTLMAGSLATVLISGGAKSTYSPPEMESSTAAEDARSARTQEVIEAALKSAGLWQNESREQVYNYYGGDPLEYRNRNRNAAALNVAARRARRGSL